MRTERIGRGRPFTVTADYIGEYGGGSYINLTCKACGVDVLDSIRDKVKVVSLMTLVNDAESHSCSEEPA